REHAAASHGNALPRKVRVSPANKPPQHPRLLGCRFNSAPALPLLLPLLLLLSGCPVPLPPVHGQIAGGAATQPPGREKDPKEQLLAYNARLGLNPLGYTKQYDRDPVIDIAVGYELEQ